MAWLVTDDAGTEMECGEHIVKPDGFTIPERAAQIHGITTEIALQQGVDIRTVLEAVVAGIHRAVTLVAHNIQFDEKIVGSELIRAGFRNYVEEKRRLCTMLSSTDYCGLPGPYGYKWPTLADLHTRLFREGFTGAHRALADVRACARCFFELRRRRIMD